jgi:hypothetical protein
MKSHHFVAIALASWYLMIPPIKDNRLYDKAPLGKWQIAATLDSADDCKAKQQEFIRQGNQLIVDPSKSVKLVARAELMAQCVDSSDARIHSRLPTF